MARCPTKSGFWRASRKGLSGARGQPRPPPGWVSPPGDSTFGGGASEGGVQGGKPRRGGAARARISFLADGRSGRVLRGHVAWLRRVRPNTPRTRNPARAGAEAVGRGSLEMGGWGSLRPRCLVLVAL